MIRLALIGCDDEVERSAPIASRLRSGTFTVVADPEPDNAERGARMLNAVASIGGLDSLLAEHSDRFDAVVVHSPKRFHADDAKRAASAGKHLLIETPLAVSTAAADEVIETCRAAGVRLMAGQAARFLPSVQTIKACLDDGKLGEPGLLRIHRWEPRGLLIDDCRLMIEESAPSPNQQSAISNQQSPRGLVRDIDLACWMFGRQPASVYAVGRRRSDSGHETFDYVQLHLGFPEGGMALIDEARTLPAGDGYFSLSLIGSTGAAYADAHHDMQLLYRGGPPSALKTGQGSAHLLAQLEEFVAAVEGSREPAVTGADGRAAVQVAEAAARSLDAGRAAHRAGEGYELV